MFTFTLQLITSAVEAIISGSHHIHLTVGPLAVLGITLVVKFSLWMYCRAYGRYSASLSALAMDHRNDVVTNSFGTGTALLGNYIFWYVDPIGGILIGFYIMYNWFTTGFEHVRNLTGRTASIAFLQNITYLALNHDSRILKIDTVRAFHLGLGYLVEIDLVLPPEMSLKEAHDIGETLQSKLEQIAQVERAFVHLDYETEHAPEHIKQKQATVELEEIDD